jgi:hypothetical protein
VVQRDQLDEATPASRATSLIPVLGHPFEVNRAVAALTIVAFVSSARFARSEES